MLNQKNNHWLTSRLIINYFNLFGAEDEIDEKAHAFKPEYIKNQRSKNKLL